MEMTVKPIGFIRTKAEKIPRHWTISNEEGVLEIFDEFARGIADIEAGMRIVVLFHFHRSPEFTPNDIIQTPANKSELRGIFSICSPIRPNPIGMSVLSVLEKRPNYLRVKHIDMIDGTPIIDIKPHITD